MKLAMSPLSPATRLLELLQQTQRALVCRSLAVAERHEGFDSSGSGWAKVVRHLQRLKNIFRDIMIEGPA